jgi:hypothetical protein
VESVLQMQREGTIGRRLPKCYSKQWLWPSPVRPIPPTVQTGVGPCSHSSRQQGKEDLFSKKKT